MVSKWQEWCFYIDENYPIGNEDQHWWFKTVGRNGGKWLWVEEKDGAGALLMNLALSRRVFLFFFFGKWKADWLSQSEKGKGKGGGTGGERVRHKMVLWYSGGVNDQGNKWLNKITTQKEEPTGVSCPAFD